MTRHIVRTLLFVVAVCFALIPVARPPIRSVLGSAYELVADHNAQPVCHKGVDGAFGNWQTEQKTREFPNVGGESQASLAVIAEFDEMPEIKAHYSYVPGLTRDDPDDLVLMYVNQPTRWTWHGHTPTIFTEKAWILVPIDMKTRGQRDRDKLPPGEFSERVPVDEFRARLDKTLKFLEREKRPNWEAVVKEHSAFLKTIDGKSPNPGEVK